MSADGIVEPVRFSIITPTRKRRRSLLLMLEALAKQDYPLESFEVIVVADGADDELIDLLHKGRYPYRLRAMAQAHGGPAAARNRGVAEAVEPFVLFIDDDVIPEPCLLRQHAESHGVPDVAVMGPLLAAGVARPAPWTVWEWATLQEQYRGLQAGEWEPTPRQFFTGNASVRLEHVRAVGGFNTEFRRAEDVELGWRLHDIGLSFVFNPRARAAHLAERSFDAWLNAAHEYGRADVMLERTRTGGGLPSYVQEEFYERHPYTRMLTRLILAEPRMWRAVAACGHLASRATSRFGRQALAGQVCSALFTCGYWRGVAGQLGREQAIAMTAALHPTPSEAAA